MDVRKVIKDRMKALGWTKYRLALALSPKRIAPGTVYDFLRGDSQMTAGLLGHTFDALGLKVIVDPDWTPDSILESKRGVRPVRRRKQT